MSVSDRWRVLVADDSASARAAIRDALRGTPFSVCAEAVDAHSAIRKALEHQPDVALIDVGMPGNGITAVSRISARQPQTAVVVLTVSDRDEDLFAAFRAGADGYLLKETAHARLAASLEAVLAGEVAVPRPLVSRLVDEFVRRGQRRRLSVRVPAARRLSRREQEVLVLLGEGLSTAEIAERLFVEPVTVRVHIWRMLRKLKVDDRHALAELARATPSSPSSSSSSSPPGSSSSLGFVD